MQDKPRSEKAAEQHTRNERQAREALARGYAVSQEARIGKRARAFILKKTNVLQLSALRKIVEITEDNQVKLGGTRKVLEAPSQDVFVLV